MFVTFLKDWALYFLLMSSAYVFVGAICAISYFPGFIEGLGLHSVIIFIYSLICSVISIWLRRWKREEFKPYITAFFYFDFYVLMLLAFIFMMTHSP
ncbi:MAG: hypothetical protein COB36_00760 [Alphaproteobacteria bacterium]|nr:MAG: hypothetical protein COB36_00760 [Alphaproteobacteria bacterium]